MKHLRTVSDPSRRALLRATGMGAAGLALGACSTDASPSPSSAPGTPGAATDAAATIPDPAITPSATAPTALRVADFDGVPTCTVLPETTAGPFPTIEQLDRRDVREGLPGEPLRLGMRVVDADCSPVPGALVEIWHTDVTGDYSSYEDGGSGKDEGAGTTFMRGFQTTDEDGIVEFWTVYPGWYDGRCVHIHIAVDVGGATVLSSQIVFRDAFTAALFASHPDYVDNGQPDTLVVEDFISRDAEDEGTYVLAVSGVDTGFGTGTLGLITVGVPA